jgi:hypothetical protein
LLHVLVERDDDMARTGRRSFLPTFVFAIAIASPVSAMAQDASAPAAVVSTRRGFCVSLDADAGYSYLTNMFDLDKGGAHGMLYGATVNIFWPTKEPSYSGGIRLRGFAAPQMNMIGHTFFMTDDATYFVGGASLGVIFENRRAARGRRSTSSSTRWPAV